MNREFKVTPAIKDHKGQMVLKDLPESLVHQGRKEKLDLQVQAASLEFLGLLERLVHPDLSVH